MIMTNVNDMSKLIKIPVTFSFEREVITNMLEAALTTHSTYWCEIVKMNDVFEGDCVIKDTEDDDKQHNLTTGRVISGLYKLSQSKKEFHHLNAIMQEEDDGITADVLLQFCLFGEVLYG